MMRWTCLPLMLGLAACSGSKEDPDPPPSEDADADTDTDTDTDADTDTDSDTDADADADTDTDTDPGPLIGELARVGLVDIDGGWLGTEELVFKADEGDGDVLCQIRYTVTATAERTDCGNCDFAWDVVFGGAEVVIDEGQCLAITGYDASNIGTLDGTTRGYGYDPDYVGHAEIMMVDFGDGNGWGPGTYCSLDEKTLTIDYEWIDGKYEYEE